MKYNTALYRCVRSVLSRLPANILPLRPFRLVNKIYVHNAADAADIKDIINSGGRGRGTPLLKERRCASEKMNNTSKLEQSGSGPSLVWSLKDTILNQSHKSLLILWENQLDWRTSHRTRWAKVFDWMYCVIWLTFALHACKSPVADALVSIGVWYTRSSIGTMVIVVRAEGQSRWVEKN